jgi:hypothetical protein
VNTIHVTWERATSPLSKTSLNISPSFTYYDRVDYRGYSEKVSGGGLELGKKLYVSRIDSSAPMKGFYAAGSLSYGYYSADYQRSDDSSYIYNTGYGNHTAYTSTGKFYHENIQRIGADVFIGFQFPIKKVFYIDTFFGAGMRYGISSQGRNSNYNYSIIDLAYSGIVPKAGIKIGLKL